ncbi:MAG: DUF1501 domain-containing protein, partial [Proteobacteria bacterium]|nr:DUF1501 domain-containing protein [Pseudomonadota bacterium]
MDSDQQFFLEHHKEITRRWFLGRMGLGIGGLALSSISPGGLGAATAPVEGSIRAPHFAPRAKRVIALHMAGSPPQQDLFDPKPLLKEMDGQPCPDHLMKDEIFPFIKGHPKILASPYEFERDPQSGMEISELMPELRKVSNEICMIRSMHTEQFNHAPAQMFIYTGSPRFGRP